MIGHWDLPEENYQESGGEDVEELTNHEARVRQGEQGEQVPLLLRGHVANEQAGVRPGLQEQSTKMGEMYAEQHQAGRYYLHDATESDDKSWQMHRRRSTLSGPAALSEISTSQIPQP